VITIIILIVILILLDMTAENLFILRVRKEDLGGRISAAHIADMHKRSFGKNNKSLIKKLSSQKPDIILISGDLISRDFTDFSGAKATLASLSKIAPTYVVFGNHEADLPPTLKEEFIQIVINSGAVLINNKTVQLKIHDQKINLCGLVLPHSVYKKNESYRCLDTINSDEINDILGKKPEGKTILMVHNPLFADEYADWGADYTVSGHVHGGAVNIPFTRIGLLSPERKLFPKYTRGIYTISNMKLLLSGGLGKLRAFNPPEIVIYKL